MVKLQKALPFRSKWWLTNMISLFYKGIVLKDKQALSQAIACANYSIEFHNNNKVCWDYPITDYVVTFLCGDLNCNEYLRKNKKFLIPLYKKLKEIYRELRLDNLIIDLQLYKIEGKWW